MNQRDLISDLLEKNPEYRQRKNRYLLIEKITGIKASICKQICSLADEYRHQTKKDEVGERLEATWHKTPLLHQFENESHQHIKSLF